MDEKQLNDLIPSLNFEPHKPRPLGLAAYCWNEWQLTSWDKNTGVALDLSSTHSFIEAMKVSYPALSFVELARIYTLWESLSEFKIATKIEWRSFFESYGVKFDELLCMALININSCSSDFQQWLELRQVS